MKNERVALVHGLPMNSDVALVKNLLAKILTPHALMRVAPIWLANSHTDAKRAGVFTEWLLRERGRIVDRSAPSSSRDITFTQSELASYALGQLRPITQLIAQSEQDMMDFLNYVNKWPKLAALKGGNVAAKKKRKGKDPTRDKAGEHEVEDDDGAFVLNPPAHIKPGAKRQKRLPGVHEHGRK
ncbi:hypothetical protein KFE25_010421 [Diacronema lutheri]|uniref:Uncharacterized protein n=1 Tax=Diacronema lutheri TaxID=2081491 RepID=A0A8J5X754_DIALT|nr:hypothetical protein KFE25_009798 [Diacronema lutheri]KAG8460353.1 hypothetical protein KFE25_011844 [Diacronema lutheri]KAG8460866.1 hypothetical protein KFE25_010921 [Diacronema lutheri]KAG8462596.1 hypothetical protein KFE25_010421 [Diacronema lutheri]